ncbi:MAG: hypothetical protein WC613_04880 [Candidatus Aenigmatarchaeota archaeon]
MARIIDFKTRRESVQIYVGQDNEAYHGLVEIDCPEIGDFLWVRRKKPDFPGAVKEITEIVYNAVFPICANTLSYTIHNGFPEKIKKQITSTDIKQWVPTSELSPLTGDELKLLSEEMRLKYEKGLSNRRTVQPAIR